MGINLAWCAVAGKFQHGGPEQSVKVKNILTDEMNHFGITAGPNKLVSSACDRRFCLK